MHFIFNHPLLYFLFSLNEIIQNNYYRFCQGFQSYAIYLSLACIRLFSVSQIYFKNTKVFLKKILIKTNPSLNEFFNSYYQKKNVKDIEFVVDGKITHSTTKENILNKPAINPFPHSLMIYSEMNFENSDKPILLKKIFNDLPCDEYKCEPANYKFILTEILIDDKKLMIHFANSDYSYFVVGNVFNDPFIKYYLNKYYLKDLEENNIHLDRLKEYTVKILDQDVKEVFFTNNSVLIINRDTYEIKESQPN